VILLIDDALLIFVVGIVVVGRQVLLMPTHCTLHTVAGLLRWFRMVMVMMMTVPGQTATGTAMPLHCNMEAI